MFTSKLGWHIWKFRRGLEYKTISNLFVKGHRNTIDSELNDMNKVLEGKIHHHFFWQNLNGG